MPSSSTFLIVGAGFSGAVVARELAEAGVASVVLERRPHVAGNCHTVRDPRTGILLHRYGPHIFNTSLEDVWRYVNRFAEFSSYVNRVKATTPRGVFSLPVNLHTLNQFFDRTFSPSEARAFVAGLGDARIQEPRNFEEAALKHLGSELYETFYRGYTVKQWGEDPKDIPASVFARLPIRFTYDDNYYNKRYQGIPLQGYTELVRRILDHPLIDLQLGTPYRRPLSKGFAHTVYTGPIDAYFEHGEGRLGYRTVTWDRADHAGDFQGVACMNYPDLSVPWTRRIEPRHFTPHENFAQTAVFTEFSKESAPGDDLFYPKRLAADKALLARYQALAEKLPRVSFLGRLGTYRYLDMDVTISEALGHAGTLLRIK